MNQGWLPSRCHQIAMASTYCVCSISPPLNYVRHLKCCVLKHCSRPFKQIVLYWQQWVKALYSENMLLSWLEGSMIRWQNIDNFRSNHIEVLYPAQYLTSFKCLQVPTHIQLLNSPTCYCSHSLWTDRFRFPAKKAKVVLSKEPPSLAFLPFTDRLFSPCDGWCGKLISLWGTNHGSE